MVENNKYISGFKEFDKLLTKLPKRIENKVLQKASRESGKIYLKAVKASAPKEKEGKQSAASIKYGTLQKNLKLRILRKGKKLGRRGIRVHSGDAFWGRFSEFGTRYIKAKPWFRPAIIANHDAVIKKLEKEIGAGVIREAKLLSKKYRTFVKTGFDRGK